MEGLLQVLLCIPTLNGQKYLPELLISIRQQTVQPDFFLAIDSGSDDRTVAILQESGVRVHSIARDEFDHGGTRQIAVDMFSDAEIVFFLTQDAIPAHPEAFENLLRSFEDATVGAAYGRQLPRPGADLIESHARLFNYPPESRVKGLEDAATMGIKTTFISNSFAAYRRSALLQAGGFPRKVICTEDAFATAKMILNGWKVAYCGEAPVYHSHRYGILEEFRRYYDIGYFYGKESWIGRSFAGTLHEGQRFVVSELNFLRRRNFLLIPSALLRNFVKLCGYKLGGRAESHPLWVKKVCSMNSNYWLTKKFDTDKTCAKI